MKQNQSKGCYTTVTAVARKPMKNWTLIICRKDGVVSRKSKFVLYAKFWIQKIHSKAKKLLRASLFKRTNVELNAPFSVWIFHFSFEMRIIETNNEINIAIINSNSHSMGYASPGSTINWVPCLPLIRISLEFLRDRYIEGCCPFCSFLTDAEINWRSI